MIGHPVWPGSQTIRMAALVCLLATTACGGAKSQLQDGAAVSGASPPVTPRETTANTDVKLQALLAAQPALVIENTEVTGIGRLPLSAVAAAIGESVFEPLAIDRKASIGSWQCKVEQVGPPTLRAEGDVLVISLPIRSEAALVAFGKRLKNFSMRQVTARVKPVLTPDGIGLQALHIGAKASQRPMGKAKVFLYDETEKLLQQGPIEGLRRELSELSLTVAPSLLPLPLSQPQQDAHATGMLCLQLRPSHMYISRVSVDPSFLRVAAAVVTRPSLTRGCLPATEAADPARKAKLNVTLDEDRIPQKTRLTVRIAATGKLAEGRKQLEPEHAQALVAKAVSGLQNGVLVAGRRWHTRMSKPEIVITAQRLVGKSVWIDAQVTGWLVVGETARR